MLWIVTNISYYRNREFHKSFKSRFYFVNFTNNDFHESWKLKVLQTCIFTKCQYTKATIMNPVLFWVQIYLHQNSYFQGAYCSCVNKNDFNRPDNSFNTLQKIRVNNPLRTTVEQMNINSVTNKFDAFCSIFKQKIDILLVYGTKIDDIFPLAQFCVERYSTFFKLGRT